MPMGHINKGFMSKEVKCEAKNPLMRDPAVHPPPSVAHHLGVDLPSNIEWFTFELNLPLLSIVGGIEKHNDTGNNVINYSKSKSKMMDGQIYYGSK